MELHDGGQFIVQTLDRDAAKVPAARKRIQSENKYGPVSVNVLNSESLPFADNLINLLVVDDPMGIPREEMLRVLRPLGTVWLAKGAPDQKESMEWEKIVKPWPAGMDE